MGDDRDGGWDDERAAALIGSTLRVGIRRLDHAGRETGRDAVFGTVVACDPSVGTAIDLGGAGVTHVVPPALSAPRPADPGTCRAPTLGEIESPDFLATFDVHAPPPSRPLRRSLLLTPMRGSCGEEGLSRGAGGS